MLAVKSTALPSGVKLVGVSSAEWSVSRFAWPPSAGITYTSRLPLRSEANAIFEPSGDHTGLVLYESPSVSGIAAPPVAGTRQRLPRYSNAMVFPSGEIAG